MNLPTKYDMTPDQEKHIEMARIAAMSQAPAWVYYYHMEMIEYPTLAVPTAGVDGRRLFFNPPYFMTLAIPECVFALVHEMYHATQLHPQRMKFYRQQGTIRGLPFDPVFYNCCADFIINADLVRLNIGRINPNWLYDPQITGDELVEDLYVKLWKQRPPPPPNPNPNPTGRGGQAPSSAPISAPLPPQFQGKTAGDAGKTARAAKGDAQAKAAGGRFDEVMEPQIDEATGADDIPTEGEYREAMARAANAAREVGKLPASFERLVEKLAEPQVSWREHVRMLLTGRMGRRHADWQRPNRRRIVLNPILYLPGKRGFGADTVAVVIDNSGSISKNEYDAFYGEVGGILQDVRPKNIIMIWCDAEVQRVEHVRAMAELEHITTTTTRGGGGTDFHPPFAYLKKEGIVPETLIYLTDMYGTFPTEPTYPVVWCSTTNTTAPFGDVVRINVEDE